MKKDSNFANFWEEMMSLSLCNNNSNRNSDHLLINVAFLKLAILWETLSIRMC